MIDCRDDDDAAKNPDTVPVVTIEVDPDALPSEGWERVDLEGIWESELLPLIEGSVYLQRVHESCVADWLASKGPAMRKHYGRRRWRCADPTAQSPFFMSSSDGAVMYVDGLMQKARETDDEEVFLYDALMTVLCMELSPPPVVEKWLTAQSNAIYGSFAPARSEVRWWRPAHSCHSFVPFLAMLATAWDSKALWTIARGEHHSTVVDADALRIFDWLLLSSDEEPGESMSPSEPVLFAQGSPRSTSLQASRKLAASERRRRKKMTQRQGEA
jgi:hypothetical protein